MADYDYIVVGGGSGGRVLANRLFETQAAQVLLLEAGHRRFDVDRHPGGLQDAPQLPALQLAVCH